MIKKYYYKEDHLKIKCKCGSEKFIIYQKYGGGGSGIYFVFECLKCNEPNFFDFENPFYEG